MDIQKVLELLPHRYPMLLIDRVAACEPGQSVEALKNVSINEPFFQGHFPTDPVMPGVLICEALAQACALVALSAHQDHAGRIVYLAGMDKVRFRRPVRPGDQLRLFAELENTRRGVMMFVCRAEVDGERAAELRIMAVVQD